MARVMDIFDIHRTVIDDYRAFTSGFVDIRDPRIREFVTRRLDSGAQWPDPWISLNPSFESGGTIPELVRAGLLHPECERIFRAARAYETATEWHKARPPSDRARGEKAAVDSKRGA